MHIEHIALWTSDIERCVGFFVHYFGGSAGSRYVNPKKGFESVFVSFASGTRLEIMKTSALKPVHVQEGAQRMGLTHLAICVGSEQQVDELTKRLEKDGHLVMDGPRRTGDGFYESVVLDPDGNRIEIAS